MKFLYKSPGNRFTVEFEGAGEKEIWKQVASFQDVFETNNTHCNTDVLFCMRTVDGNDYYEKKCPKCGMKFAYGQHKSGGGLFPNSAKGWHKWTPESSENDDGPPFDAKGGNKKKGK